MTEQFNTEHRATANLGNGKEMTISTGEIAKQAGGAAIVHYGDTVVLATANMGKPLYEEGDFLPLLVDFEERFYAAGKIKGSRFIKREGRPSEEATLTARLTDRSIRPIFPDGMINDVQVVITVLSYDQENDPDVLGIVAASAALSISNVPWDGPLAAVRIGRIDGTFVVNPTTSEREKSSMDLIVAGTAQRVVMIEGDAQEEPENVILDAIEFAQEALGKINPAISTLQEAVGKEKKEPTLMKNDPKLIERLEELALPTLTEHIAKATKKSDFRAAEAAAMEAVMQGLTDEEKETVPEAFIKRAIHNVRGNYAREQAFKNGWREGGRALDEIRPITVKAGILPRTHGSSLFQRGETQVVNVATLGGPADVQLIDTMELEAKKHYIHYYNFPAFSVGENKPSRGPGRREIGHGALAERALMPVLPPKEDWPYTMLLVSEVLESNGSSSMASVCGSTLSLMDAGVPIKAPVAGIAMGLFTDENGEHRIMTDIAGVEDEKGDMDFKVAGTKTGITAVQMDIKVHGITREIMSAALEQAKGARLFILEQMAAVLPEPRREMSPYAPKIESMRVPVEKIGDLIGPKGKHINAIIEETNVEIDIDDDGLVSITGTNPEGMKKAVDWVKNMTREVKPGETFDGKVTKLMDFGAFVELVPGLEGMVHISQFRDEHVADIHDVAAVGDTLPVVVLEIDKMGRINLSHKAAIGDPDKNRSDTDRSQPSSDSNKGPRRPYNPPKPPQPPRR